MSTTMSRILIVDDEPENRDALVRALGDENPGWEILTAASAAEGIDCVKAQLAKHEPIDAVLTDLVMETSDGGMQLLQVAQQLDPLVMAILFTAKEQSLDRYAALALGAFDVVEKNIRGMSAVREIMMKTRAALRYREWSRRINFVRRYFDPRVFDLIEREPELLEPQQRLVTICFWDIRGFSKLCETLKEHPTLISGFLREYCEIAAQTIFRHGGLLDKFIGDGVMSLFGVLNHHDEKGKEDAIAAVEAALDLGPRLEELTDRWMKQWMMYTAESIDIGLGCGIHTGDVLVGNVGTEFRDQFTALGPHVNFAARIEGRSKAGQILVSQSTQARIASQLETSLVDEVDDIKNIPGKYRLFEVSS